MVTLPSPLHPAVVHFPIVLILIGAAVAAVSVVVNRWHLSWAAAILLALGALGAYVTVETGESAQEIAGKLAGAADRLLDDHEEWAEWTEVVSGIGAALAIAAAALGSLASRRASRQKEGIVKTQPTQATIGWSSLVALALTARAVTAAVALITCFFVYKTGRLGGELVYEHGVGVKTPSGQATMTSH